MHFGGKSHGEAPQETPPTSPQGPSVSSKARSENMRESGRGFLTPSHAGVFFQPPGCLRPSRNRHCLPDPLQFSRQLLKRRIGFPLKAMMFIAGSAITGRGMAGHPHPYFPPDPQLLHQRHSGAPAIMTRPANVPSGPTADHARTWVEAWVQICGAPIYVNKSCT